MHDVSTVLPREPALAVQYPTVRVGLRNVNFANRQYVFDFLGQDDNPGTYLRVSIDKSFDWPISVRPGRRSPARKGDTGALRHPMLWLSFPPQQSRRIYRQTTQALVHRKRGELGYIQAVLPPKHISNMASLAPLIGTSDGDAKLVVLCVVNRRGALAMPPGRT